tara:strand:+ start:741 stop:953 length:213 start_codon:yes stop_codon:yes gene_type:complete
LNIYAILIACVQAVSSPLEDTCGDFPLYDRTFETIPECIAYIDNFARTVSSANTDLYVTGFCTTKDINET